MSLKLVHHVFHSNSLQLPPHLNASSQYKVNKLSVGIKFLLISGAYPRSLYRLVNGPHCGEPGSDGTLITSNDDHSPATPTIANPTHLSTTNLVSHSELLASSILRESALVTPAVISFVCSPHQNQLACWSGDLQPSQGRRREYVLDSTQTVSKTDCAISENGWLQAGAGSGRGWWRVED